MVKNSKGSSVLVMSVFLFMIMSFRFNTINESASTTAYEQYLTGGSSRQWNIVDNYPKNTSSVCNFPSARSSDNVYTFYLNNTFSFNSGLIQWNDSSDLCFDPENFNGNWEVLENNTKLKLQVIENNSQSVNYVDTLNIEIMNDSIFIVSKQGINHVFKRK